MERSVHDLFSVRNMFLSGVVGTVSRWCRRARCFRGFPIRRLAAVWRAIVRQNPAADVSWFASRRFIEIAGIL